MVPPNQLWAERMNQRIADRLVSLAILRGLRAYAVETDPVLNDTWIVVLNTWPEDPEMITLTDSTLVSSLHWLDLPEINE